MRRIVQERLRATRSRKRSALLSSVADACAVLIVLGAFFAITYLIDIFDWGEGVLRGLVLLLVVVVTSIVVFVAPSRQQKSLPRGVYVMLTILCLVAIGWHFTQFYDSFLTPSLIDIATTTLAAGRLMLAGMNPYSFPVDPVAASYSGFKYLPMMAVTFLPLGTILGIRGIVATNLLLDLAVAILLYRAGSLVGIRGFGIFSALLYLITSYVPLEVYHFGSTDLAAVVPLLFALLLLDSKKAAAGFCTGLSIATKLSPGVFFAVCFLPSSNRLRYVCGVAVGMLPIVPYLLSSPADFFSNIILYPIYRPADSTSWAYYLSPEYRILGSIAVAATLIAMGSLVWFRNPSLLQRCGFLVISTVAAIVGGPIMHRNYQLWWLPFFAIVVSAASYHMLKVMNGGSLIERRHR